MGYNTIVIDPAWDLPLDKNVLIRTKVWNYNREDMQALVTLLQLQEVEE